jgi:hypothetical protein
MISIMTPGCKLWKLWCKRYNKMQQWKGGYYRYDSYAKIFFGGTSLLYNKETNIRYSICLSSIIL